MVDKQLTLTAEEQEYLLGLLETARKATLVEEHRTRALEYREHIVQREALITSLLEKLRAGVATPA
jgi:hypothetical protein